MNLKDYTHEKMLLEESFRKSTQKVWVKPMFDELMIKIVIFKGLQLNFLRPFGNATGKLFFFSSRFYK